MTKPSEKTFKWYEFNWENPRLPIQIGIIILFMWLLNLNAIWFCPNIRGTFGDMFGAVNALFSGLAFVGIIYSIRLQQIELKNQQIEMKVQSEEFKIQNSVLRLQQFENTFLSLLKSHNSYLDHLDIRVHLPLHTQTATGKYIFSYLNSSIKQHLDKFVTTGQATYNTEIVDKTPAITMYITSLDTVVKFLERATISEQDKQFYGSVIKSQMYKDELYFLTRHIMYYNPLNTFDEQLITRLKKYFLPDPVPESLK